MKEYASDVFSWLWHCEKVLTILCIARNSSIVLKRLNCKTFASQANSFFETTFHFYKLKLIRIV